MRSIWTGSIVYGLVNVPVKAHGATEDHDVSLHQIHDADGDRAVVLTDKEVKSLPAEQGREMEVVQFVPNDQIDAITLERSCCLESDSKSPKAYALLVKTLESTSWAISTPLSIKCSCRRALMKSSSMATRSTRLPDGGT